MFFLSHYLPRIGNLIASQFLQRQILDENVLFANKILNFESYNFKFPSLLLENIFKILKFKN